jgi:hypothetical protein
MSDKEISANAYLGETYRRIFGSGEENKPSRQQIVEPQIAQGIDAQIHEAITKTPNDYIREGRAEGLRVNRIINKTEATGPTSEIEISYRDIQHLAFESGRLSGIREAVEAVQGLFKHKFSGHFTEDEVIAAIKAQEGK